MLKNFLIRQLLLLGACILLLTFLVLKGLKIYTHHGEKLILPDYIDKTLENSLEDAERSSFRIEVTDSIFIVGKAGGVIINQNPLPGSTVKRERKIYVTISKSNADMIAVRNLPRLYGEFFEIKKKELLKGFEIKSKVVDKIFDAGLPEMIMEVRFNGKTIIDKNERKDEVLIPKGGLLEFILSQSTGGNFLVPDLRCKTLDAAMTQIELSNLVMGEKITDGSLIENSSDAYVTEQEPSSNGDKTLGIGDTIHLYISKHKPKDCQ